MESKEKLNFEKKRRREEKSGNDNEECLKGIDSFFILLIDKVYDQKIFLQNMMVHKNNTWSGESATGAAICFCCCCYRRTTGRVLKK